MPMNPGMYTSEKGDWGTPQWLFDRLDEVFHFNLDVCASEWNAKCETWMDEDFNALLHPWGPSVDGPLTGWMNPPYGRAMPKWMAKLYLEWEQGGQFVALLPARADTMWFQYYLHAAWGVLFLKGRLSYEYLCAHPKCDEITLWLYGTGRGKTTPFCPKHGELVGEQFKAADEEWKRRRSTAPFSSCLAFFLHPRREPSFEQLLTLQDLGQIYHPRGYDVANITP